ncbi:MAG TPA: sialidase [Polyangia bacterium]|nr:sialidase [Polyangia bacterium]
MRAPFTAAVLAVSSFVLVAPAHARSVDDIVSRAIAAQGGADKLRAIRTLRLTGAVHIGGEGFSLDAQVGTLYQRDGRIRSEFTVQGLTAVDALDATDAWHFQPFEGRREAQRATEDEVALMGQDAEFEGPLLDWQKKGYRVDYLGTEDVDGTTAHKLRVTRKNGNVDWIYLDPDTYLVIRTVQQAKVRGAERVSETDYGAYESVAGVWMPFSLETGPKGGPHNMRTTIERAEVNVDVPASAFSYPKKGQVVARLIIAGPTKTEQAEALPPPPPARPPVIDSGVISGLGVRNIGSAAMSGRVAAVAARVENGKTLLFVGAASGGVWKSSDGGTTFKPVFDKERVQSIGAITIDPTNPKTIWVGTGEGWTRNSTSIGDGIYKSTDEGETWTNMGLPHSERIVRILVHPKNGNIVYACVPGKLWSDSADRGLYRTTDGGRSWSLVLRGKSLSTGCSSVTMDPKNPDVLLAGMWDFRRKGWTFRSGGDGPDAPSASGLYRSSDGGASWKEISTEKGLPKAPWGRVEVVYAPSDPKIVYAFVESTESGLFRSADGGATWEARDRSQNMVWRPFYFARLVVDPLQPNRIFKPDLSLIVSDDGGKSFVGTGGGSHGDWHDLWIDPTNTKHIIGGDDGGLWLSYDGGNRWWKANNLPISQFYHVTVDNKDPYQVYGGLQDNSSWVGDSQYPGGITNSRWENLYGGDGFWVVADPTDPEAVYAESQGGYIGRVDRRTHAGRDIQPKAHYKEKLRFNWNTPIAVSPTQKGTLYIGAQFLFRSRDHGDNWERISPDLTTNDPEKQKQEQSGGVTVDNSEAEMHTTIYSISESPKDPKTVWVGTDDGNLQLTRDAGKTWSNVVGNVAGLPKASWVSWVEASKYAAGTAFVTFDRHTFGDMTPWVFRTDDFGKSWKRIVGADSGVNGYAHVVKQDPVKPSMLYVGTELGLWISLDAGAHWAQFRPNNFPSVAVRDLQIHPRENDLVLATHGRGIWIVDDVTPLRALSADTVQKPVAFLPSRMVQQRLQAQAGWVEGDASFWGDNPPPGVVITFYQRTRQLYGRIKLEILDDKGKVLDTIVPPKRRGLNRVVWSMQTKPPKVPRAAQWALASSQGPRVVPGVYTVRLTRGKDVIETKLKIDLDRRAPWKIADRKQQFDAAERIAGLFGEMSEIVGKLDGAAAGARDRLSKLGPKDPLADKIKQLSQKIEDTRKKVVATKEGGAITGEERIREHLDHLYGAINGWEGRPARYQLERIDALKHELDDVGKELQLLGKNEIAPIGELLRARHLPPIELVEREGADDDEGETGITSASAERCYRSRGSECQVAVEADRRR